MDMRRTAKVALQSITKDLTKTPALAVYNTERETIVSADVSSYGLGDVIRQKQLDGVFQTHSVRFSLTPVERRYAQIEETLAITRAFKKFVVETDQKPLVPPLSSKGLH